MAWKLKSRRKNFWELFFLFIAAVFLPFAIVSVLRWRLKTWKWFIYCTLMCGLLYDANGEKKNVNRKWLIKSSGRNFRGEFTLMKVKIFPKLARLRKLFSSRPFFAYSNSLPSFYCPTVCVHPRTNRRTTKKKNVCRAAEKSAWWRVIRAMTRTLSGQRFARRALQSRNFPWAVQIVNDFIMPILGLFLCFCALAVHGNVFFFFSPALERRRRQLFQDLSYQITLVAALIVRWFNWASISCV